jgi:hypothetical protein
MESHSNFCNNSMSSKVTIESNYPFERKHIEYVHPIDNEFEKPPDLSTESLKIKKIKTVKINPEPITFEKSHKRLDQLVYEWTKSLHQNVTTVKKVKVR